LKLTTLSSIFFALWVFDSHTLFANTTGNSGLHNPSNYNLYSENFVIGPVENFSYQNKTYNFGIVSNEEEGCSDFIERTNSLSDKTKSLYLNDTKITPRSIGYVTIYNKISRKVAGKTEDACYVLNIKSSDNNSYTLVNFIYSYLMKSYIEDNKYKSSYFYLVKGASLSNGDYNVEDGEVKNLFFVVR